MDNKLLREYEMNDNHENMNEMTWKMKMIMKSFLELYIWMMLIYSLKKYYYNLQSIELCSLHILARKSINTKRF